MPWHMTTLATSGGFNEKVWYNEAKQRFVRKSILVALGERLDGYSRRDLTEHLGYNMRATEITPQYVSRLLWAMLEEGCITESDGTELHVISLYNPNAYLSSRPLQTSGATMLSETNKEKPAKIYRLSARRWLEEQVDHVK